MLKYGLKLWTNNVELFDEARSLYENKKIDFIELYYNDAVPLNLNKIKALSGIMVNIHSTDNGGFESFNIGKSELDVWRKIIQLAVYFDSRYIILHPGREHSLKTFQANLEKIDDNRILIENMAGLDVNNRPMYASKLGDLNKIIKIKKICFDLEKAAKSANYQKKDYKTFIELCLRKLEPFYFHISGGDTNNPKDEHKNLWESNFDIDWIKKILFKISAKKEIYLVFEIPKKDNNLRNDIKNMEYFRNL